jgi:hypothetical protein
MLLAADLPADVRCLTLSQLNAWLLGAGASLRIAAATCPSCGNQAQLAFVCETCRDAASTCCEACAFECHDECHVGRGHKFHYVCPSRAELVGADFPAAHFAMCDFCEGSFCERCQAKAAGGGRRAMRFCAACGKSSCAVCDCIDEAEQRCPGCPLDESPRCCPLCDEGREDGATFGDAECVGLLCYRCSTNGELEWHAEEKKKLDRPVCGEEEEDDDDECEPCRKRARLSPGDLDMYMSDSSTP